jgi:uncharacterized membrane protein YdjX (TVP38/TMEM64 family)
MGFACSLAAATVSNVICFIVARYIARDWVVRRINCNPKHAAMLKGMRRGSWKVILMTRLNPILPSAVAGYCFGVTPVRFRTYLWASVAGNAPLCLLMAWFGSTGRQVFDPGEEQRTLNYILWGLAAASTVTMIIWVSRYTTRKLKEYAEGYAMAATFRR